MLKKTKQVNDMITQALRVVPQELKMEVILHLALNTKRGLESASRELRLEVCKILHGHLSLHGRRVILADDQPDYSMYKFDI